MTKLDLDALAEKAKRATKGTYSICAPKVKFSEEVQKNHGGWRVDSFLKVKKAYDSVNEEGYKRQNTPKKYRHKYTRQEKIIDQFTYRGPGQTGANARFLAALDPETVLKLIDLARKGLNQNG